ncbi:MAG: deoxyhypusine synthase [Thermoplasmata archaeon]
MCPDDDPGRKVKDIHLEDAQGLDDLMKGFEEAGGFTAKKIAEGAHILERMVTNKDCITFLSFPACVVATGVRGVIKDLVKKKLVDVIVTTCGTLDHDLARCWKDYYHGSFHMDDSSLRDKGISRLGNVLVPDESYGIILEEKLQPMLQKLWDEGKKKVSTKDLSWYFGKETANEGSILYWAEKNQIPVYVPGITDGSVGYQLWSFWQDHKDFTIDLFQDEKELADIVFEAGETGALMIGGGISKHHVMWWNQFRDGLDYVVYITTAQEFDGSLSGARIREGISWGKVKSKANKVTIDGDATVVLPLLVATLFERIQD